MKIIVLILFLWWFVMTVGCLLHKFSVWFFDIVKVDEPKVHEHKKDEPQVKEQDERNEDRDSATNYGFCLEKNTLNRITFLITWCGKPWQKISIEKTSIEQLKKELLEAFQNFETWIEAVKTKGCVDGYNKLLLKQNNDFELYAIIENKTPRLMLVICGHTMTGNLTEMVGFWTDLFKIIGDTEEFDKLLTKKQ